MLQFVKNALYMATWSQARMPRLDGRVFIVTGGNSGLGYEACKALVAQGATVVMAARNEQRCLEAIKQVRSEVPDGGSLQYMHLQLASLKSVRRFAEEFTAQNLPLHCLICNAGLGIPDESKTEDGFESQLGTNFYGHELLIHLLLPQLKRSAPSRLVIMSSPEESRGFVLWDDIIGSKVEKGDFNHYGAANLYKLMVGKELAERLKGSGMDVFIVQPGMTQTDFFRKMDFSQTESTTHNKMQQMAGQRAPTGVISTLFAATEPSLEGHSGEYIGPYYWRMPNWFSLSFPMTANMFQTMSLYPANAEAKDPAKRQRLYEVTMDALQEALHQPVPNRLPQPAAA